MSSEIAKAYVGLLPAYQGGASGIESQLRGPAESAGRTTGSRFGKVFASASMRPIRAVGGAALGLFAADKIKDFLASSISQASDAQQSLGATQTVFNKYASTIIKDSRRASAAYGLSANEFRESSNLIGALLKNQGVAQDKLAGQTEKLVGLGADLSATYGGTAKSAVEALSSAFKGEFDPLEAYGVSLKQSTINTEAFRLANVKSQSEFGKLSVAAQRAYDQQATMKILFTQTAAAQGQFAKQTNTLAEQQQIAGAAFDDLKAKVGDAALPVMTKFFGYLSSSAIPAVSTFITQMQTGEGAGGDFADVLGTIADDAKKVASVGVGVGKFFSGLPGPLKSIAIEGGIAALIFPRISAAVTGTTTAIGFNIARLQQFRAEMTYTETRSVALSGMMSRLGGAAKAAAGVAGMVLLTESTKTANKNLGLLEKTAGGAALGLATGSPWAAAIGGSIGLIAGLASKMHAANAATRSFAGVLSRDAAIKGYTKDTNDLRDSLNQVTGAFTASTNAGIRDKLVKSGQLPTLNKMGISTRALILAIKGNKTALDSVAPGFDKLGTKIDAAQAKAAKLRGILAAVQAKGANTAAGDQELKNQGFAGSFADLVKQYQAILNVKNGLVAARAVLPGFTKDMKNNQAAIRQSTFDARDYAKTLKSAGFNKTLVGKIQVNGIKQSAQGVASVVEKFKIARKNSNLVALIKASGWQVTNKHLQAVIDKLRETDKTKVSLKAFQSSITTGVSGTSRTAKVKVRDLAKAIGQPISTMKPDMRQFLQGVASSLTGMKAPGKKGAGEVANFIIAGLKNGLSSQSGIIGSQAAAIVRNAIAQMHAAADSHSPSRETMKLGVFMGDGLRIGLRDSMRKTTSTAGRSMKNLIGKFHGLGSGAVAAFSSGITGSENEAGKAVDKMMAAISKAIVSKKNKDGISKAAAQAMRRVVKEISKEATALRSTIGKRKSLVGDIASSLSGELDFASLISSDANTFGFTSTGSASSIVAGAQSIVARLKTFAVKLRALSKAGMPAALLQEITGLGSTDGLKVANAFLADKGEIKQLKSAYNQIGTYSKSIGSLVGDATYGQKIRQQQGQLDAMLGKHQKHQAKDIGKAVSDALRATPMVLEIDGKQTGRIYLAGKHNAAKYA